MADKITIRSLESEDLTPEQIAKFIYEEFAIHQSVRVYGFILSEYTKQLVPKGQIVVQELDKLYREEYMSTSIVTDKASRKYKYPKHFIGGPFAHPIFLYDYKIVDKEPRYTIWRTQ